MTFFPKRNDLPDAPNDDKDTKSLSFAEIFKRNSRSRSAIQTDINNTSRKPVPIENFEQKRAENIERRHREAELVNQMSAAQIHELAERNRRNGEEMKQGNWVEGAGNVVESYINDGHTLQNAMQAERDIYLRNAFRSLHAACTVYNRRQESHVKQAILLSRNKLSAMHVHVSNEAIREYIDIIAKDRPTQSKYAYFIDQNGNTHNTACGLVYLLLKLNAMNTLAELDANMADLLFTKEEFDSLTEQLAAILSELMVERNSKNINVTKMIRVSRKCQCQNCSAKKYKEQNLVDLITPTLKSVMRHVK